MGICNKELINPESKKFFNDLSNSQAINQNNNFLSEKIKLKVLISQITSNCKYNIKLYNKIGNKNYTLNEQSQCSISENATVILNSPILIQYYFEKEQILIIEILKSEHGNTKKYELKTTLGCIMGSRNAIFQKRISPSSNEIIIIQGEKLIQSEDVIYIKFEIKPNHYIDFRKGINKIYYEIYSESILYRSECFNEQGKFYPVKIPLHLFNKNMIKILFIKNTGDIIKEVNLNIYEFGKENIFDLNSFQVISRSRITKNYTFVDYLKAGIEIGLTVAIDFTGSNGNPTHASSLHYIYGNKPSQYERAIKACGDIVGYYDFDQLYPCFGFGAKINNVPKLLFNLNFKQDPNVAYIDGIIEEYHNAIKKVQLWGPTNFAPIIREMNNIIKEQRHKLKYHILMILTDGIIDDIDDTIDELVEGSFLPLSVIIIGIGNADFSNMIILDADDSPLVNSRGVKAVRDLVQFVPFLKYENYPENLAMEVLEEVPRQIVDYYEQNNIDPISLTL